MHKSELASEHVERINLAVSNGLDCMDWEPISLLSGGLTGVPVIKISVQGNFYVIKLESSNDKNFDLVRNHAIVEAVSKQGISPKVYFTDPARGIILMQFIEAKRSAEEAPVLIKKFTGLIRRLHDNNTFQPWKTVIEIMDHFYQKLSSEYVEKALVKKCMQEVQNMEAILFDPRDVRACHCDLNPANVLFDGKDYFFVDWQAASPQSLYFDLACCATWFYFYNEELCSLVLESYLGREANKEEKAKYYLMRIFANIYFGIGFITLPLQVKPDYQPLHDDEIAKLSTYLSFMQSLGGGQVDLGDPAIQQKFGFIFLKTAESMMLNQKYEQACEYLNGK